MRYGTSNRRETIVALFLLPFFWALGGVAWTGWVISHGQAPEGSIGMVWQFVSTLVLGIPSAVLVAINLNRISIRWILKAIGKATWLRSMRYVFFVSFVVAGFWLPIYLNSSFGFSGSYITDRSFLTLFILLGIAVYALLEKSSQSREAQKHFRYKGKEGKNGRKKVRIV